jgi:hypothetical protein
MDKNTRNTVAVAVAAVVCVILPFLRLHPLIALLFGVATYFLVRDVLPLSRPEKEIVAEDEEESSEVLEVLDRQLQELLHKGNALAARFDALAGEITRSETAEDVGQIASLVRRLFKNFAEDPEDLDIPASQTFLNTNLDRALRLVESYVKLSRQPLRPEQERSLRDAEEAIGLTRHGFEALLAECQENNLRQLHMDSRVLSRMIESRFPHLLEPSGDKNNKG